VAEVELPDDLKQIAFEEFGETPEKRRIAILELRDESPFLKRKIGWLGSFVLERMIWIKRKNRRSSIIIFYLSTKPS
jgi:hypothetical protein